MVSEPTSQALWSRGAGCLSGVGTNLPGTVGQGYNLLKWCQNLPPRHCGAGCRLFKWCRNLPQGHCGAGVQAVLAVLEPISQALWGRGARCISGFGTYLPGNVGQGCKLFKWCQSLPPEHCGEGGRLFKRCQNLPPGHCWAGLQAI